jgi:hypothetical protein
MVKNIPACPLERISWIRFFISPLCHWCIIGFGIVLRIAQFLYNRSLTEGEAALALNIISKSYSQLLQPLDHAQAAPVGFLYLQRVMVSLLGNTEIAMRLLPLVAGCASCVLFYYVARRILEPSALSIGLLLFAASDHAIYFASEVKQYSTDVFLALCILWFALWIITDKESPVSIILYAGFSGLALWFSHPFLFVIAGCSVVLFVRLIKRHAKQKLLLLSLFLLIPVVSFILNYAIYLGAAARNEQLIDFWQSAFMPFPPTSLSDLTWYPYVFLRAFKFPVGLSFYTLGLAVLASACGFVTLVRIKRTYLALLIAPIIVTLIVSALHRYPFEGRLILFITPLVIIILAEGLEYLRQSIAQRNFAFGTLLILIILAYPVGLACCRLVKPRAPEELRTVMEYVDEHKAPGDAIYLYYGSINAFQYYTLRYTWTQNPVNGIEARDNWERYYQDIDRMRGERRGWFLFSHIATTYGVNEEELFVSYLNKIGKQIDHCHASGASAYLYDLTLSNEQ